MILINKYFLILLLFLGNISFAQDYLKQQFDLAKKLFDEENYYDAVTEFKRLQFFDTSNVYLSSSDDLIAQSYKNGGKFDDAIHYFTLAEINAANNDDIFRIKIEIVRVNILRRTADNALRLLDDLEKDKRWYNKSDEINYWRGWTYIFADEWDKAAEEFSKISTSNELKLLCEKTDKEKYSVTFAKIASVFLPGAGQFYTGNYLSGLLSFGWCALWGYVSVNAFVEQRVFDGLAVANFLWFRFYRGNLENAEKFAVEKNIQISNESLKFLQNNYKGEKP
jgi:TM2 domain-containing membrane protein YozV